MFHAMKGEFQQHCPLAFSNLIIIRISQLPEYIITALILTHSCENKQQWTGGNPKVTFPADQLMLLRVRDSISIAIRFL